MKTGETSLTVVAWTVILTVAGGKNVGDDGNNADEGRARAVTVVDCWLRGRLQEIKRRLKREDWFGEEKTEERRLLVVKFGIFNLGISWITECLKFWIVKCECQERRLIRWVTDSQLLCLRYVQANRRVTRGNYTDFFSPAGKLVQSVVKSRF